MHIYKHTHMQGIYVCVYVCMYKKVLGGDVWRF